MDSSLGDEILKNNSGSNIGVRELLLSGTQALVQATLIQKERDEFLGLNTAGYITGYRGSPLGSVDKEFNKSNSFLAEKSKAPPLLFEAQSACSFAWSPRWPAEA